MTGRWGETETRARDRDRYIVDFRGRAEMIDGEG